MFLICDYWSVVNTLLFIVVMASIIGQSITKLLFDFSIEPTLVLALWITQYNSGQLEKPVQFTTACQIL